jgi:hypothetical protein
MLEIEIFENVENQVSRILATVLDENHFLKMILCEEQDYLSLLTEDRVAPNVCRIVSELVAT